MRPCARFLLGLAVCLPAQSALPAARSFAHSIVFTQVPAGSAAEISGARSGGMLGADLGDGARLVLLEPGRPPRVLTPRFASAADPDVSFDGRRILFAGRRAAGDRWAIYEMDADGSNEREVVAGSDDLRQPIHLPPLYTLTTDPYKGTDPWEAIACVRVSASEVNEAGDAPRSNIASFRSGTPDGAPVRLLLPLAFNLSNEMDPALLPDGRVLFATWERAAPERAAGGRVALAAMNTDGSDPARFSDDEGRRIKRMPCVTPDRLAIFVESERSAWDGSGTLAAVSLRRNLHSYRPLTAGKDGLFHSPSALPQGGILAARRPAGGSGTHGIVRVDPDTGRIEPVFDDPRFHDLQPKALAPRPRPDARSSPIKESEPEGKIYALNVYRNDLPAGTLPGGSIKSLRAIEGLPRLAGSSDDGTAPSARKRLLGEAPVEADGSFQIQVPANVPVQIQVLDEDGLALRTSGWHWVHGKGQQGCAGCHENPEMAPANRFITALEKPATNLAPPPERRRSVDFAHDVLPIVQRRCVACHQGGGVPLESGPSDLPTRTHRAYETLLADLRPSGDGSLAGRWVHPGRARTSPLIWHLLGRNTSRPWDGASAAAPAVPMAPGAGITGEERRLFIEWIDLGALWDARGDLAPPHGGAGTGGR